MPRNNTISTSAKTSAVWQLIVCHAACMHFSSSLLFRSLSAKNVKRNEPNSPHGCFPTTAAAAVAAKVGTQSFACCLLVFSSSSSSSSSFLLRRCTQSSSPSSVLAHLVYISSKSKQLLARQARGRKRKPRRLSIVSRVPFRTGASGKQSEMFKKPARALLSRVGGWLPVGAAAAEGKGKREKGRSSG
jgi:hypothetical protein